MKSFFKEIPSWNYLFRTLCSFYFYLVLVLGKKYRGNNDTRLKKSERRG